jgi:hypothetical protein
VLVHIPATNDVLEFLSKVIPAGALHALTLRLKWSMGVQANMILEK